MAIRNKSILYLGASTKKRVGG